MHLILAGHGKLAQEIVNSANMVFGQMDQLDVVTFLPGENTETLKRKYQEIMKKMGSIYAGSDPRASRERRRFL